MRFALSIVTFIAAQLAYILRLEPLTSFSEREILIGLASLSFWTICEAILLLRSARLNGPRKTAVEAPTTTPPVQNQQREGILEAERDELRKKVTELTLKTKDQDAALALVQRKLTEAEKAGSQKSDEQEVRARAIVSFVGRLQDKGRLVDFLMDDVTPYSDAQVGAAARVVHQGCQALLREQLQIVPLRPEAEASVCEVAPGYDPREWRIVGSVKSAPPFKGTLLHRGWKAEKVNLSRPTQEQDLKIISPAELEVR